MNHVALFRNLNLGHPGSPTMDELVDAFGGPARARGFQSNGTVLFRSDDPDADAGRALDTLRRSGHRHHVVVRMLADVEEAVRQAPAADPSEDVYRTMLSFYDVDDVPTVTLPLRSPDRLVEVRHIAPGSAASACWKPRNQAGDVTGFLEALLDVPVTTRTLSTCQRLVDAARRTRA